MLYNIDRAPQYTLGVTLGGKAISDVTRWLKFSPLTKQSISGINLSGKRGNKIGTICYQKSETAIRMVITCKGLLGWERGIS
jgi:hypothetical protein